MKHELGWSPETVHLPIRKLVMFFRTTLENLSSWNLQKYQDETFQSFLVLLISLHLTGASNKLLIQNFAFPELELVYYSSVVTGSEH